MNENKTDYSKIIPGTVTGHGIVDRILAKSDDFIIFFNSEGILKLLTDRDDPVCQAAKLEARNLSTLAGRKFHGVYQERIDQFLGHCMASALQKGVELNKIKEIFGAAREYIDNENPIKKLIGSGKKYRYRVFLDHKGNLGCECGETITDSHLTTQLAKIDRLCRIINSQVFRWFRAGITNVMGAAMLSLFSTEDHREREIAVDDATTHATRMVREHHHIWYFITLLMVAAIGLYAFYLMGSKVPTEWKFGISGGVAGSIISSLMRIESVSFELTQSRINVIFQAISRVLTGATSGFLVIIASKSGIALSIIEGNVYAIILVSFAAGFSERFIPDILARVMSETSIK